MVAPDRAEHYRDPLKEWEPSQDAFFSATNDIEEAKKCSALERSACVFHLMRAPRSAARRAAVYDSVPPPLRLDLAP
jgi:hypothetical protein